MQERLAEKIAVAGVPQVQHLTTCTFVGKQPEYMHWNRDGDFLHLITFVTMLDVRFNVLGSRHISFDACRRAQKLVPSKRAVNRFFASDEALACSTGWKKVDDMRVDDAVVSFLAGHIDVQTESVADKAGWRASRIGTWFQPGGSTRARHCARRPCSCMHARTDAAKTAATATERRVSLRRAIRPLQRRKDRCRRAF